MHLGEYISTKSSSDTGTVLCSWSHCSVKCASFGSASHGSDVATGGVEDENEETSAAARLPVPALAGAATLAACALALAPQL